MNWYVTARYLLVSVAGYLVGSISWAYLAVRVLRGDDLRAQGTGNLGARNAMRSVGPGWALAVGLGDAAKGASGVMLARFLVGTPFSEWTALFFVLLGHCYSIFLKGAGGKGLAAGMGGILLISPPLLGMALGVGAMALVLSRTIYTMAVLSVLSLPVIYVLWAGAGVELIPLLALVLLVLWRHRRHLSHSVSAGMASR